jgi:chromosome segregation ATPase
MVDYLLVLVGVLLVVTIGAAIEYFAQIRRAQREYEKAKSAVEDIILSINREMKREADKLQTIEYKVAGNIGRADTLFKKADSLEKRAFSLENQMSNFSDNAANILAKVSETDTRLDARLRSIELSNDELKAKVLDVEEQVQKFTAMPEAGESVIQIRRDKAMGPLTDTEIAVLEMLSAEGPKTAPEIKERVHLSREHTARLMKKLYEGGYLERETNKIPFRYSVKKEMEKLLKKPESGQA